MENVIKFLKTLDEVVATSVPDEYTAISVGAARDGYIVLDIDDDNNIIAKLTKKGIALISKGDYPTLVECRANGAIVLASAPTCGTVLVSDDPTMSMGLFRMDWTDFSNTDVWERLQAGDVVNLTQKETSS